MSPLLISFFIPSLAGIMTTIGYLPTYISKKHQETVIAFSLSFSAGVMITISLISLIPESIELLKYQEKSLYPILAIVFILGIILSNKLDCILRNKEKDTKLYQLGIFSLITLILHNIPEGITTFLTTTSNLKLGISLSLAIALHNIPEGIAIAIPIYYATNNRRKAFLYTVISGFSELLGAIIAFLFIRKLSFLLLAILLSGTAGIMIDISIRELIPNALDYTNLKNCILGILLGSIIMLICIFIFKI